MSSASTILFIQFARAPREGMVKTRMFPALSPEGACQLHRELMLWTCRRLLDSGLGDVELWLSEASADAAVAQCVQLGVRALRQQQGEDLGERMYHAICDGLERYQQVVLVGSDCPGIDREYLMAATAALREHRLVLGPATDGGYVLIGLTASNRALFTEVSWGDATVFKTTVQRAEQLGWSWHALSPLHDVDRPDDLSSWEMLRKAQGFSGRQGEA